MDAVMDMEPAICAVTKAESIENTDVITMRNINKSYRMGTQSLHVLKDVSLTVKQGEYLAILGPSGSGKSTLMNIIGCMDVMDSGNYLLDGVAIEQAKEKELVKIRNQKIGFIFQKYHLIPTYNVLQNIVMPLLMRGWGDSRRLRRRVWTRLTCSGFHSVSDISPMNFPVVSSSAWRLRVRWSENRLFYLQMSRQARSM